MSTGNAGSLRFYAGQVYGHGTPYTLQVSRLQANAKWRNVHMEPAGLVVACYLPIPCTTQGVADVIIVKEWERASHFNPPFLLF